MNAAIARRRGKAQKVIADVEEIGRRRPLVTATGGAVLGAAAAITVKAFGGRRSADASGRRSGKGADFAGTRAHSYGRDNPSGPGYGWPPEPALSA